MSTELTSAKPTNTQLAYIRELAKQTGTEFSYPGTAAKAHRDIERLTQRSERQGQAIERFTQLAEGSGLPIPDQIERQGDAVRFLWTDRKVMVVIDLDDLADEASDADAIA